MEYWLRVFQEPIIFCGHQMQVSKARLQSFHSLYTQSLRLRGWKQLQA